MKRSLFHLVVAGAMAAAVVSPSLAAAGHHGAHVVVPPGQTGPRVRPSSLYPDPTLTPGATNPDITQANIADTICSPNWSTKTIRLPASYTNNLKKQQLGAARYVDKTLSHYEEDHLISLELGGNPRDPKEPVAGDVGHPRAAVDPLGAHSRRSSSEPRPRTRWRTRSTEKSARGRSPSRRRRPSSRRIGSSTTRRRS